MGTSKRPGGLYLNANGRGFHDAHGEPVSPEEAIEFLSDEQIEALRGAHAPDLEDEDGDEDEDEEDPDTQVAGSIAPEGDELGKDFPGYEQLLAAGLGTKSAVFAHPNIIDVKGIGPATAKQIEALRPKAPEA